MKGNVMKFAGNLLRVAVDVIYPTCPVSARGMYFASCQQAEHVYHEGLCALQIDNMEDYINQDLAVKVIEADIEKQRVVFSARKANEQLEEYNVSKWLSCAKSTVLGALAVTSKCLCCKS